MASDTPESCELPNGWFRPDADEVLSLHAELQRELPPGHILYGVPVLTFAMRRGNDDVLFRHRNEPNLFTVIHLSWLGRTEINARHPTVEFAGSFSGFIAWEESILEFCRNEAKKRTPKT
jgi:hypothetical protein